MDSTDIISLILGKYKAKCNTLSSFVSNDNLTSFYISQQRSNNLPAVQIRLSNHGTFLKTWVDRVNLKNSKERLLDPSHSINISIVFLDEGNNLTKDCENQINCDDCEITPCEPRVFEGQNELGHPFSVHQFVYKSKCIRRKHIDGIVGAIIRALQQGKYIDPLNNTMRKASSKELKSNYSPQNNSLNKKIKKENINMKKQVIRITEGDLHKIIKESVNKVLDESEEKIPAHKFLPELNKTYTHLYREYSRWQYSPAKPEGMDEAIDAIINAMHVVQDIIHDIEWKQNGMPIYDTDEHR